MLQIIKIIDQFGNVHVHFHLFVDNEHDFNRFPASDTRVIIDLNKSDDSFYSGHCIDGNIVFPTTGYLMIAWRQLAASVCKTWVELPVVFENIQFKRPVFLSESKITELKVNFNIDSGKLFEFNNSFIN